MNNKITITASDGKVFAGTLDNYVTLIKELNVYEDDLKLKKQKEQEEHAMRVVKAEAVYNEIEILKERLLTKVNEYKSLSGVSLVININDTVSYIRYEGCSCDYIMNQMTKAVRKY